MAGQLKTFDDATVRVCLECHAPIAAKTDEIDLSILEAGNEAVGCIACHVREGKVLGPRNLVETPHGPIVGDRRFSKAEFCGPCHQFEPGDVAVNGKLLENTLEEWRSSRYGQLGVTCQACHMAAGYHGFRGIHDPATVRRALSLTVERTSDGIRMELLNRGAGHFVPTYITPRLQLRVTRLDNGQTLGTWQIHRRMDWTPSDGWREISDTRLAPAEQRLLAVSLPADASVSVDLAVFPDADYHDRVYPYLIRTLSEELDREALRRLKDALKASGTSDYELYRVTCGAAAEAPYRCK